MDLVLAYMGMITQWLFTFCVATAADIAFTFYIRRTSAGKALPAACWSAMIALGSAANVIEYTAHPVLVIPMILGYFVGTYATVTFDMRKHDASVPNP